MRASVMPSARYSSPEVGGHIGGGFGREDRHSSVRRMVPSARQTTPSRSRAGSPTPPHTSMQPSHLRSRPPLPRSPCANCKRSSTQECRGFLVSLPDRGCKAYPTPGKWFSDVRSAAADPSACSQLVNVLGKIALLDKVSRPIISFISFPSRERAANFRTSARRVSNTFGRVAQVSPLAEIRSPSRRVTGRLRRSCLDRRTILPSHFLRTS